jgi:hypothetical protein
MRPNAQHLILVIKSLSDGKEQVPWEVTLNCPVLEKRFPSSLIVLIVLCEDLRVGTGNPKS